MVIGFVGLVAFIVVMVTVPVAIYAAVKAINRVTSTLPLQAPPLGVEARLRRMEEAIDAMAQQVERLRISDRYVSAERDDPRPLPPPDDPPTFR